jgi:flagellar hook assembly protein FlgD
VGALQAFHLGPVIPNPSRGSLEVSYSLPSPSAVRLAVYDLPGRRVATLVDGEREAGDHRAPWAGEAEGRRSAPTGVYWFRLEALGHIRVANFLLVR